MATDLHKWPWLPNFLEAPLRKFILFSLTVSSLILTAQTHADSAVSCKPNYQPEYDACKPTGRSSGQKTVVEKMTPVTGACQPDINEICAAHKVDLLRNHPDVRLQDVQVFPSQDAAFGKSCSRGFNIYTKQDVTCEYHFSANVPEMKPDPSCSVIGASDVNGCFTNNKIVNLDVQSVKDCLDMRPQTRGEIWMQSVCLSDVYNAQNNSQLATDLPKEIYDRVQVRLESIRNRAKTPDDVRNFLAKEQQR